MKKLGILGGTFDPIHNGHLNIAFAALKTLNLNQVLFIPCGIPAHRNTPHASNAQRLKMLRLAVRKMPFFKVSDLELQKNTPSYSIETLMSLREFYGFSKTQFFWIIGSDAFNQIQTWHCWEQLFSYTHFAVFNRPEFPLQNLKTFQKFEKENTGKIFKIPNPPLFISSTQIRGDFKENKNEIPKAVGKYILKNNIYF